MAKSTKSFMVRRGVKYTIERKADGTFGRFIPVGKTGAKKSAKKQASVKKSGTKKVSAKTSSKQTTRKTTTARRARV